MKTCIFDFDNLCVCCAGTDDAIDDIVNYADLRKGEMTTKGFVNRIEWDHIYANVYKYTLRGSLRSFQLRRMIERRGLLVSDDVIMEAFLITNEIARGLFGVTDEEAEIIKERSFWKDVIEEEGRGEPRTQAAG